MKPIKEENGGNGVAAILYRMAREDLSEQVTCETSGGANHIQAQIWGESIIGRKKTEDPGARVCLVNLKNSKGGGSPVRGGDGADHCQSLVIQSKVRISVSPCARNPLESCEQGKDTVRLYFKRITPANGPSQGNIGWYLGRVWC